MLIGNLDAFERGKLFGWAFNPQDAREHLVVRVMAGPEVIAEGPAKLARPDLPDAGVGAGDHAFEFALPPRIRSLRDIVVTAHSAKHGKLVLTALPKDNPELNALLEIYTSRYNSALAMLRSQFDDAIQEVESLKREGLQVAASASPETESRLAALESRMESVEVFLLRIDETLRLLAESRRSPHKWGLPRLFGKGHG